jgi:hypothetical protein
VLQQRHLNNLHPRTYKMCPVTQRIMAARSAIMTFYAVDCGENGLADWLARPQSSCYSPYIFGEVERYMQSVN